MYIEEVGDLLSLLTLLNTLLPSPVLMLLLLLLLLLLPTSLLLLLLLAACLSSTQSAGTTRDNLGLLNI
jgi:hypothetical protein